MPIGFLYSGTLWLGNAAYMYLSVSFIQMLKVLPSATQFPSASLQREMEAIPLPNLNAD